MGQFAISATGTVLEANSGSYLSNTHYQWSKEVVQEDSGLVASSSNGVAGYILSTLLSEMNFFIVTCHIYLKKTNKQKTHTCQLWKVMH